jgi:hypothetical protein
MILVELPSYGEKRLNEMIIQKLRNSDFIEVVAFFSGMPGFQISFLDIVTENGLSIDHAWLQSVAPSLSFGERPRISPRVSTPKPITVRLT